MATLATSFLIGSSSFLGITRTTTICRMSSNFSQVRPQVEELAALERLEKSPFFDWIFFILTGNKDNYHISDVFEFQPDPTSDCGVSCPYVLEKSLFCVLATQAPSVLIGSSTYLDVTRIAITSRMTSNFSQIRPLTAELSVLDCVKYLVLWPLKRLHFCSDFLYSLK